MTEAVSEASAGTIAACLEGGLQGFTAGNRLSLPFRADLLAVVIGRQRSTVAEPERITDFSPISKKVCVVEHEARTDLYFRKHKSLQEDLGRWRGRLLIECCEVGGDIFDPATHLRLICSFRDDEPTVQIALQE